MTEPKTDQRCGTCKFWKKWEEFIRHGDCAAKVPSSVTVLDRVPMAGDDGVDCPCYAKRESEAT